MENLQKLILRINGKGYKVYKDLKGQYQFNYFSLTLDHVQGDPFAAPSRVSLKIPMQSAGFPSELWINRPNSNIRKIALEDFIARAAKRSINDIILGHRGSGNSGLITIDCNQQQVLLRNAINIHPQFIEARIVMGLPAQGRRIAGQHAIDMFFNELPRIVEQSLFFSSLHQQSLEQHINSIEDQHVLRERLNSQNLVGFIANGALLPRRSGIHDQPLDNEVVPFQSPESLETSISVPNAGSIKGMGVKQGVTLIVGGGFHGKSTLLHALERGIYNHIPGDGREKVVTNNSAVKIRAEDGRAISRVNISPFIDRLPLGRDTRRFTTSNASGSTSQAANIIEALECGSKLLLIDEDTSATNFMIRDERMQKLVIQEKEPITPLLYRIRELYDTQDISSIIVMGGSGDYFDIADTVIMMDTYQPHDVTLQAKNLAGSDNRQIPDNINQLPAFQFQSKRMPGPKTLNAARGHREVKIDAKDLKTLVYGEHRIDLSQVEQLIDVGQTRAIGLMIHYYAQKYSNHGNSMIEELRQLFDDIEQNGLDCISPHKVGNLALPRLYELAATINRIRCDDWN